MKIVRFFFLALITGFLASQALGQQVSVSLEDYQRAERAMSRYTRALVFSENVSPNWLDDDLFWYRNRTVSGSEFILVNPERKTKRVLFDHERLANGMSQILDTTLTGSDLPFTRISLGGDLRTLSTRVNNTFISCSLRNYRCTANEPVAPTARRSNRMSPDGKLEAYIDTNNLWVRETETDEKRQLTTDGIQDYGYATNNAGWIKSNNPVLLWSPDSKKIATFQHDGRGIGEMHLLSTNVGRPNLESWKYPMPGDSLIFRISRVIIDVESGDVLRLDMPPDPHRSTTTDHVADWGGKFLDVRWSDDTNQIAFISSSRDHKTATLRIADTKTGAVRDVLEEVTETYYESGVDAENWDVLFESEEVIWYSERDNWGHLYLYDLNSGELKNQITRGDWAVQQVRKIDEKSRKIYFTAGGREPGNPYFQHFYSINFDGSDLKHLSKESANHNITLSPSGQYFIDRFSTPSIAPETVLKDMDGNVLVALEKADISPLLQTDWVPPEEIKVKGRDGETDIYGLLYKPSNFDPNKSYPVLNYLYPGPQSGSVGSRSFRASRSDKQAVAELGFIVVEVDAMGTPGRSKSFHDAYYGNMGDNGLPDQIAAIKELAGRHPWMDLDRVGIWGHSGGGFASTRAILQYPDFYKVAVSSAGNHDNRNYEDDWGEKWQGLLVENPDGTTNYDNQANHLLAKNLKGKLLIAHGTMDSNVPPSNTMLMVDALIKANKDFDLLMIPNAGHGFGSAYYYWTRRRWDYFVRHLIGVEPPKEFEFGKQQPGVKITQPTG